MFEYRVEYGYKQRLSNQWIWSVLSDDELSEYKKTFTGDETLKNEDLENIRSRLFCERVAFSESRLIARGKTRVRVINDQGEVTRLYVDEGIDICKPHQKWIIDLLEYHGLSKTEISVAVSEFVKYWKD